MPACKRARVAIRACEASMEAKEPERRLRLPFSERSAVTALSGLLPRRRQHFRIVLAYIEPWLGEEGQAALYRQIAQNDQRYTDEVEPLYGEIERPVLILWGEEDRWLPLEIGEKLHSSIPGSQLRTIPECAHLERVSKQLIQRFGALQLSGVRVPGRIQKRRSS